MERRESTAIIWEEAGALIESAVSDAALLQPLPPPPLLFEEMPVIEPDGETLQQRAMGLHAIDRAGHARRLAMIVERHCPDYVRRAVDEERAMEKWMSEASAELAAGTVLTCLTEWLAAALDPGVPDGERWYLAIALLTGLARTAPSVLEGEAAHLLESIAIAAPPGRWSTKAPKGPHQLDWREGDISGDEAPNTHLDGAGAASWLLDVLSEDAASNAVILAELMSTFAVRPHLHTSLRYVDRVIDLAEGDASIAMASCSALPHLSVSDSDNASSLASILLAHESANVRRRLMETAPSILPVDVNLALSLVDGGLDDDDGDVRVLATSALNVVDRWDESAFIERCERASSHDDPRVRRRFGQAGLRSCLAIDPTDSRGILTRMWSDDDETLRARLTTFMIEIASSNPDAFAQQLDRLESSDPSGVARLREAMDTRDTSL